MRLAAEGRLSLDAPVGRYLPSYPNAAIRNHATVAMLLTHQSGLGDIFSDAFLATASKGMSLGQIASSFEGDDLVAQPGERFSYSNAGYVVLGRIIETVTRSSFDRAIAALVLRPARAPHAGWTQEPRGPTLATSYTREDSSQQWVHDSSLDALPAQSAGGGAASVSDLLAFDAALWGNRLLSPSDTRATVRGRVPRGPMEAGRYGYGFFEAVVLGDTLVGHNGSAPGARAEYFHSLRSGGAMVILANVDGEAVDQVTARVRALLARAAESAPTHR
jgi:CubicO group peptidase (beta-lactamase class C family)